MVFQNPTPEQQPTRLGHPSKEDVIFMMNFVLLQARSQDYETPPPMTPFNNDSPEFSSNATNGPLHIERPSLDTVIHPPKGVIRNSLHNPSVHVAQHYSIVEDLSQVPCAMSTLKVLQNCPSQHQTLLSTIGAFDSNTSSLITFNTKSVIPRLSHQLAFQITVGGKGKKLHQTTIDEGSSTCIMSFSCWRAIGSPELAQSSMTLKAFDGKSFTPYGILNNLMVELGGKNASIKVWMIDSPLDYNVLLG